MSRYLADSGWTFDVITQEKQGSSRRPERSAWEHPGIRTHEVPAPNWVQPCVDFIAAIKRKLVGTRRSAETAAPRPRPGNATRSFPFPPERHGVYERVTSMVNVLRFTYPELVWSRRAVRCARRLAKVVRYRAVIVSAPPHASNLVGLSLSRSLGLPFIADFRDLWIHGMPEIEPMNPIFRWLGARYEPQVFREAYRIVCNTELAKEAIDRSPLVRADTTLSIPNGFDARAAAAPDYEHFRVVFTGRLYPFADLEVLFAACSRLRDRARGDGDRIRVEFMPIGPTYRDVPLRDVANFHGIDDMFVLHPRSSRDRAWELQQSAAVLVAFDQSIRPSVPTKFYDYVQHRGAVLMIGRPRGSLAPAASRLGLRVYDPTDRRGIDEFLDTALQRWRHRAFDRSNDPDGIYDRRHQSRRWHELLMSIDTPESRTRGPSLAVGDDANRAAV